MAGRMGLVVARRNRSIHYCNNSHRPIRKGLIMDLTNELLGVAMSANKVKATSLTYCDEISSDIYSQLRKTGKYKVGDLRYDVNGMVQFVEHRGRGYRIDVRPLPVDCCSRCGRKMQPVGYNRELLCVRMNGLPGCDDPKQSQRNASPKADASNSNIANNKEQNNESK